MGTTLLDGILFTCNHQFSWPRRGDAGDYYQVCLRCGAEYSYDWNAMRRIKRIDVEGEREVSTRAGRRPVKRAWVPRERRIKHEVPVLYRKKGSPEWLHGNCENVSRTGILIRAEQPLASDLELEVMLEMPVEITGQERNNVLCQANCVRTMPGKEEGTCHIAVAVRGYEFIELERAC